MRKLLIFIIICICTNAFSQEISLEQCRNSALEKSFSAKEAQLNIRAAKLQQEEAFTEFFPRISLSANAFRSVRPLIELGIADIDNASIQEQLYSLAFSLGLKTKYSLPKYGYSTEAILAQPIFAGGRIINGNKLAALGTKAAQLTNEVNNRKIIEEVDEYFWQTVSLCDKLSSLNIFTDLVNNLYKDAKSALDAGLITEDDFSQIELKRNELKATQIKLQNGIKLSKINLLNYTSLDYEFLKLDSLNFVASLSDIEDPYRLYCDEQQVAERLEELSLLSLNIEAKSLQKKMELGETLPQLAVGAAYGFGAIGDYTNHNAIAFATLSIPISDWWKSSLKQQRLQTEIDKAIAQKNYLREQLILLVRKTWVELCASWDDYNLAVDSQLAAEQSYNRKQAQYEAGLITMSDLLSSQASYQQAVDSVSDATVAYLKTLQKWNDFLD